MDIKKKGSWYIRDIESPDLFDHTARNGPLRVLSQQAAIEYFVVIIIISCGDEKAHY